KQVRGAVIGGNQDVEIAVAVEIRVGRAARHYGTVERGAHLRAHILELVVAQVAKQQRRFAVVHLGLHAPDLFLDVAVGGENIQRPIQIVVEEERAEGQRQQAGATHGGRWRLIHKKPV